MCQYQVGWQLANRLPTAERGNYCSLLPIPYSSLSLDHNRFVSWCTHVWCRLRCFDRILLVFFRRWGRLVMLDLLKHDALFWLVVFQQLWLVHFDPCCSLSDLLPWWSAVAWLSCCVSWSWAFQHLVSFNRNVRVHNDQFSPLRIHRQQWDDRRQQDHGIFRRRIAVPPIFIFPSCSALVIS